MIKLDVKGGVKELEKLRTQLSDQQIAQAASRSLNEAASKGKTQVKKAVTSVYSISSAKVSDPNKKKGLSVKRATNRNLTAEIDSGHIPLSIADLNPKYKGTTVAQGISFDKKGKAKKGKAVRRSTSQISVEVKKGDRKTIASAFTIGTATHAVSGKQFSTSAIFARGQRGKPSFAFSKKRMPIDSLSSVSIATAATNLNVKEKYSPDIEAHLSKRFEHHIKRQIDKL